MTLQPPTTDPLPPARPWHHVFLDHNPCFLLSALFMFLGCYLINSALDVRTGDENKLIALLGALNAYEIAMLCIGVLLLRRTQWNRDGVLLLLIQMLFLADAPFLLAETAMASAHFASAFNIALLLLAVVKAGVAMTALHIPLRPRTLGFLVLQLTLIYAALPLFFAHVAVDGIIGAVPMYGVWWVVGLGLPALYELLARLEPLPPDAGPRLFVRRAYLIVPWLLLIAHLGFFQWAYRAPFCAADLSPVLLGLAIATLRLRPAKFITASDLRILRVILPFVGLFLGLGTGTGNLSFPILSMSPFALTAAAAFILYAYFLSVRSAIFAVALLALFEALHILGPSPTAVASSASTAAETVYRALAFIIPSTAIGWGILAILLAFMLLAVGGSFSLRRPFTSAPPPTIIEP